MKTAMQELIIHIGSKGIKNYPLDTLELIEELLEKEKEQIEKSFFYGQNFASEFYDFERYFEENFKK